LSIVLHSVKDRDLLKGYPVQPKRRRNEYKRQRKDSQENRWYDIVIESRRESGVVGFKISDLQHRHDNMS
jgi:hypothetical protein